MSLYPLAPYDHPLRRYPLETPKDWTPLKEAAYTGNVTKIIEIIENEKNPIVEPPAKKKKITLSSSSGAVKTSPFASKPASPPPSPILISPPASPIIDSRPASPPVANETNFEKFDRLLKELEPFKNAQNVDQDVLENRITEFIKLGRDMINYAKTKKGEEKDTYNQFFGRQGNQQWIKAQKVYDSNVLIEELYSKYFPKKRSKIQSHFEHEEYAKIGKEFHVDEKSEGLELSSSISAFTIAVSRDFYYPAKILLENGASTTIRDVYGSYPIHYAVRNGSEAMLTLLMNHDPSNFGKMIRLTTSKEYNVLHMAATQNRPEFFIRLATLLKTQKIFDGEEETEYGETVLELAFRLNQRMINAVLEVFPNLRS